MKNNKPLIVIILLLVSFKFSLSFEKRLDVTSMLSPDNNYIHGAYKNQNSFISPHSAFTTSSSNSDNMSIYPFAVPPPKNQNFLTPNDKMNYIPQNTPPDEKLANKIVNDYRKKYNSIDINKDNLINEDELGKAFEIYGWPKKLNGIKDNKEYAKMEIGIYDKDKKGTLSFPEFTDYMID